MIRRYTGIMIHKYDQEPDFKYCSFYKNLLENQIALIFARQVLKSNKHILSILLSILLVLPIGIEVVHSFEHLAHHDHCKDITSLHMHEVEHACKQCDSFITLKNYVYQAAEILNQERIYSFADFYYSNTFNSFCLFHFSLRAPPTQVI